MSPVGGPIGDPVGVPIGAPIGPPIGSPIGSPIGIMEFIAFFLIAVVKILKYAILARILLSWIQPMGGGGIQQTLHDITEPILRIFRNLIPSIGMIDISPILAFFALDIVQIGIVKVFSTL
jgi:YggT family protein